MLLLVISSCSKEQILSVTEQQTEVRDEYGFYGIIAEIDTKTTYNPSNRHINWDDTDVISVNGVKYLAKPDENDARIAVFDKIDPTKPSPTAPFIAFYPEGIWNNGKPVLPQIQHYTAENNFGNINPMYAESNTSELSFKNICGILELTIKGTEKVTSIYISDEKLGMSGPLSIDSNYNAVVSGIQGVTLDCGNGVTLDESGKKFYIAIPAGEYAKLNIRVCTSDGKVFETTAKSKAKVSRNVIYGIDLGTPEFVDDYLCFTSLYGKPALELRPFSSYSQSPEYEYSKDCVNWADIEFGKVFITLEGTGDKVYVRSKQLRTRTQYSTSHIQFEIHNMYWDYDKMCIDSARVEVSGNIKYMVDPQGRQAYAVTKSYDYYGLFGAFCDGLERADKLLLEATYLSEECYGNMFSQCKSLKTTPTLPAKVLAKGCYKMMFSGCDSLTTAPELPATVLAESCYSWMFKDCKNLIEAPILPATNLAVKCYDSMFSGCEKISVAPQLPATSLADYCYSMMFCGCKSLTETPELPATELASGCYEFMFTGCSNLVSICELPAMTMKYMCYCDMFSDCKSIINAPSLPATELNTACYESMFSGCTSLKEAPALSAEIMRLSCYESMFAGCTSLIKAPELNSVKLDNSCYVSMFSGCTNLTEAPILPAETLEYSCYSRMFRNCQNINSITCLATDISAKDCTKDWVDGVAFEGTFTTPSKTGWTMGIDGIPFGWNRVDF